MKKAKLAILISSIAVLVLTMTVPVSAGMLIPASQKAKEKSKAAENSPVIEKIDEHLVLNPSGLERMVFIHYKKGFVKPSTAGGKKAPKCYGFLSKNAKWKNLPIDYVIDPDNPNGLSENFIANAISLAAEEWDAATSTELFGNYSIDYNSTWDSNFPDGKNELLFGDYPETNVIAITIAWGYFSGPPNMREIIEFDILFDTDFTWGDAKINSQVMDLQNIATHEIGHGAGLSDLYESACSQQTMYGYSNNGEIQKRDLNTGDILGIQKLYGR
jgi:hypothetical protein